MDAPVFSIFFKILECMHGCQMKNFPPCSTREVTIVQRDWISNKFRTSGNGKSNWQLFIAFGSPDKCGKPPDFSQPQTENSKPFGHMSASVFSDSVETHSAAIIGTSFIGNKTPAKHRDIFRSVRLHQLSHSCFGRGNKI